MPKLFNRRVVLILGDQQYNVDRTTPTVESQMAALEAQVELGQLDPDLAQSSLSGPQSLQVENSTSADLAELVKVPVPPPKQPGTSYADLRISFRVTKTVKSDPNKASISVYNLPKDEALRLIGLGRDLRVVLLAGHDVPTTVFEGNPSKNGVKLIKDGPDWVLKIDAATGYRQFQRAVIKETIDRPVTLNEVVAKCVEAMGVPVGYAEVPNGDQVLNQGITLSGNPSEILNRIAASVGADWSLQDNGFQMLGKNATKQVLAPVYSQENGTLLSRPQPKEKGVEFDVLLDPKVDPATRVVLEDEDGVFSGTYKAVSVTHSGDTYDNNWTTKVEAKVFKEAYRPSKLQVTVRGAIKDWLGLESPLSAEKYDEALRGVGSDLNSN